MLSRKDILRRQDPEDLLIARRRGGFAASEKAIFRCQWCLLVIVLFCSLPRPAAAQQEACAPVFAFRIADAATTPSSIPCTLTASATPLSYTLTPSATWIVVLPKSGVIQPNLTGTISVSVNTAGLAPNTYSGTITTSAAGYNIPPITVTLTVTSATSTQPVITAAVNAGSYAKNAPLSPGLIFSVFGISLSDGTTASAAGSPLPTRLAGTTLLVNGVAAPLYYASAGQTNAEFPVEINNVATASIQVQVQGPGGTVTSSGFSVAVAPFSPSLLSLDANGTGPGAIEHAKDFSLVCPANRTDCPASFASPGETIAIYALGLGPVQGPWVSGIPVPATASTTGLPVVTVGGIQAQVLFAGLTTQFVGLYQINIIIPANVPFGNTVPVSITMGGVTSNQVSISIGNQVVSPSVFQRGGGPPGGTVSLILIDPTNPSALYVVASSVASSGLFKSTNGGQSWSGPLFSVNVISNLSAFALDPTNSSVLYAGLGQGIFKSVDSGQS